MILSMSTQAMIFLTTIIIGLIIGFVYDLFRIFRKIIPHTNAVTYLEDALYWIFMAIMVFYVMLNKNSGEIRFFSILGLFLGMITYFFTLSLLFMKVSLLIVGFIKKIIRLVIEIILMPFRLLYKLLRYPINICKNRLVNYHRNTKKVLHKTKNYAKIKRKKLVNSLKIILKKV